MGCSAEDDSISSVPSLETSLSRTLVPGMGNLYAYILQVYTCLGHTCSYHTYIRTYIQPLVRATYILVVTGNNCLKMPRLSFLSPGVSVLPSKISCTATEVEPDLSPLWFAALRNIKPNSFPPSQKERRRSGTSLGRRDERRGSGTRSEKNGSEIKPKQTKM